MGTVEFLFDFGSPASYIAYRRLPAIAADARAAIVWTPILLGGVFKATGNSSPAAVPAKGAYMTEDLTRFARRYGIPFAMNPHFPINTITLMRGAAGCQLHAPGHFLAYVEAVFTAIWADGKNLGDLAVVASVLAEAGLDGGALLALAAAPDVKDRLKADTEAAIARGVFGAPTMFVDGTLYFGQDRLDFVEEALRTKTIS